MGYFSADERLEQGEAVPLAPYNLRVTEANEQLIGLAWQAPPGRLEGYLVLVREQGLEWHTALRVVGREKFLFLNFLLNLRLAAEVGGTIELAVVAYAGELVSQLSNIVVLPPRLRTPLVRATLPPIVEELQPASIETPSPTETENPEAEIAEIGNPELPKLAGWAEIEEALRHNSAALSRHGLFVNPNN